MQPSQEPIIIDISEPKGIDAGGFVDVLISALGVAGMITVFALVAGALLGGFLYWRHSRAE